jgi:hypothetical protein
MPARFAVSFAMQQALAAEYFQKLKFTASLPATSQKMHALTFQNHYPRSNQDSYAHPYDINIIITQNEI